MATFLIGVGAMTLVEGTRDPLWALATLPLWLALAKLEGLYDNDHPKIWHLTTDEAPAIFHWITLSVAGTLLFRGAAGRDDYARRRGGALFHHPWVGLCF